MDDYGDLEKDYIHWLETIAKDEAGMENPRQEFIDGLKWTKAHLVPAVQVAQEALTKLIHGLS